MFRKRTTKSREKKRINDLESELDLKSGAGSAEETEIEATESSTTSSTTIPSSSETSEQSESSELAPADCSGANYCDADIIIDEDFDEIPQDITDLLTEDPEPEPVPESIQEKVDRVSTFFTSTQAKREVSLEVMKVFIDYIRTNDEDFIAILENKALPHFKKMRKDALDEIPQVKMNVVCFNRIVNSDDIVWEGLKSMPIKQIR